MNINLNSPEYQQYLNSFKWKLIVKYMTGKYVSCARCNSQKELLVHHNSYENYPFEKEEDLTVICNECHFKHHKKTDKEASDEQREFRLLSLQNTHGTYEYSFNLNKIAGVDDLQPSKCDIFHCELCNAHMPSSHEFPLEKLILTAYGKFISASMIKGKNYKRQGMRICLLCWKRIEKNCIKTYKITPEIAKLLLTNPPNEPRKQREIPDKTLFKLPD